MQSLGRRRTLSKERLSPLRGCRRHSEKKSLSGGKGVRNKQRRGRGGLSYSSEEKEGGRAFLSKKRHGQGAFCREASLSGKSFRGKQGLSESVRGSLLKKNKLLLLQQIRGKDQSRIAGQSRKKKNISLNPKNEIM